MYNIILVFEPPTVSVISGENSRRVNLRVKSDTEV